MRLSLAAFCLLALFSVALAQTPSSDQALPTRRHRVRRPKPNLKEVNNPDGDEAGPPIPLRRTPAKAKAAVPTEAPAVISPSEDSLDADLGSDVKLKEPSDALQSLLATVAEEPLAPSFEEIDDNEEPLATPQAIPERARTSDGITGRRRIPPKVPRRKPSESRQLAVVSEEPEEKGQRIPDRPKEETVQTTDNYSHTNPDGSFTFGYVAEDGSFREETRGIDCITRGKYGYIDPDGQRREFTYVSGLPCTKDGEDGESAGEDLDNNQIEAQDPISPDERFRTAQPVQLAESEIPVAARRRPQRPRTENVQAAPTSDPALQNLFSVAGEIARQPSRAPTVATTQRPSSFDFNTEVNNFGLDRRPSIVFANTEQPRTNAAPVQVGSSFSSELVFDPSSGTFKTDLRQSVPGEQDFRVTHDSAPFIQPTQQPVTASPTPFTAFSGQRPASSPNPSPLSFTPLNFPAPSSAPTQIQQTTLSPATLPPSVPQQPQRSSFFFQPSASAGQPSPASSPTPQLTLAQQQNLLLAQQQQQFLLSQAQQSRTPAVQQATPTVAPAASSQFGFQTLQGQLQQGSPSLASRPFTTFSNGFSSQLPAQSSQQFLAQPQQQFAQQPFASQLPFQFQSQPQGNRFVPQATSPFTAFNSGSFARP